MKTDQALNTNPVNSAPKSSDFKEHYLQLIRQRALYLSPKEEKDYLNFKRMIDQILFAHG